MDKIKPLIAEPAKTQAPQDYNKSTPNSPGHPSFSNKEDLFEAPANRNLPRSILSYERQQWAKTKSSQPTREPLENPQKQPAQKRSDEAKEITRWAKIVPFEKFNANLQISFGQAIKKIRSFPEEQRQYIIVSDTDPSTPKSSSWIQKLLDTQLNQYPAQSFVQPDQVANYLQAHPEVKHVMTLDDASYSGLQMPETISELKIPEQSDIQVHVVVPYMTLEARNYIKSENQNVQPYFYSQERMLSYAELQLSKNDYLRTPTWMSHKAADNASTRYESMKSIASNMPIAPYKKTESRGNDGKVDNEAARKQQIERLKSKMPGRTLANSIPGSPLLSKVDFVQSNRGFFLLGDNYAWDSTSSGIQLEHNGQTFTLGGQNGLYQYQLHEGDLFTLSDGQETKTLELQKGHLVPIQKT